MKGIKQMKKISIALCLCIVLALSACGEKNTEVNNNQPTEVVDNSLDNQSQDEIKDENEQVKEENKENKENNQKPAEDKKPSTNKTPANGGNTTTNKTPATTNQAKPVQKPTEAKPSGDAKPQVKPEEKPVQKPQDTRALSDIVASLYEGVGELPKLMSQDLTSENFTFYTFANYVDGATAHVSEPMMGSYAHSVVLVRLPDGADVKAFAEEMRTNADARKWICVEAEKVTVTQKGNLVLLVMSSADYADTITSNFLAKA